jgi:cell division protein FtsA
MSEYIVGIDIGSSKICAAVGKVDKQDKIQIMGVTSVVCNGIKKGIVIDIDNTAESIKSCVEQLERIIDFQIKSAFVSIPGGICELIPSRGVVAVSAEDREIRSGDVERVLKAAKIISVPSNKEVVGVIPKQYIIDGYENIKEPLGMSGLRLEVDVHVVVARTTIINNLIKSVNKAGIKVNGIVLEPLAVSQVALKPDEIKMGTAIIDAGSEKIDISIFKNGNIVFTSTIPFGGNTITNDISICLKVPFSEAEKLKVKYGSLEKQNALKSESIKINGTYDNSINIDHKTLIDIIEARVDELLKLAGEIIYKNGYYKDISGIVIVGGGLSMFSGISSFAKDIFDKPIRIGIPEYVGVSTPVYNTVVGIIKDAANNSNISHIAEPKKDSYEKKEKFIDDQKEFEEENTNVISKIKGFLADFF